MGLKSKLSAIFSGTSLVNSSSSDDEPETHAVDSDK
jgi:hypothetical protein